MTKQVRIEVWDKGCAPGEPDKLVKVIELNSQTQMTGANGELYVSGTRYLVVKEAPRAEGVDEWLVSWMAIQLISANDPAVRSDQRHVASD